MPSTLLIGHAGEDAAADYLHSIGYLIRGRNVRLGHDEIDVVAYDPVDRAVVFAEVKSLARKRYADAHPAANFSGQKKRRTLRAARKWAALHHYDGSYRVDLICVIGSRVIEHLREVNFSY
ncbi:MAG: YraN family protein [Candidatus Peribacteraceae bacterium]|nr:YraN family protein [Candidatus Peribacteraceae bacterium]